MNRDYSLYPIIKIEHRIAHLKQQESGLWKKLEDDTLSTDEREKIECDIDRIHNEVMELQRKMMGLTVKYGFDN